jgi:hypothetical protein
MRRLLVLLLGLGPALAQGRLEASLLVWPRAVVALEGGLALGEGEVFFRLGSTRLGLGYAGSLPLGPWGFLAYGLEAEAGEGGWGGAVYGEGGAGPFLWEGRLGFRPRRALPLFPEEGVYGRLALTWRLPFGEALGLTLLANTPLGPWPEVEGRLLEGRYAFQSGLSLGAGLSSCPYALLGWKGEVAGGALDLALRLGGVSRLEAGLYSGAASLFLILAYPWAGSVGAWLGDLGLEAGYKEAPYARVRYAWRWP